MIHNHDRCHQHQLEPQWPDCNIRNDPRQKKHGPSARRGAGGCTNWDRWYRHAGESIARCPSYAVTGRMPQAAAASRSLKSARSSAIFPTEPPAQSIEILAYFLVQDSNCIERHSWIQRALRSMTDRFFGRLAASGNPSTVLRRAISARVLGTGFACSAPPRVDFRSVAVQLRTDILARLPNDLVYLGCSGGEARVPDHPPVLVY